MPREIRKRGKKKSKVQEEQRHEPKLPQKDAGPSWMRDASTVAGPSSEEAEAPFGYVDADVKAYFRTVDLKLREWQDGVDGDFPEGVDTNEERKSFMLAALGEMEGKELQLATDPDCSIILERLVHSMDDFGRRVLLDRFAGSYMKLASHRFASHVCQTSFTLARNAIQRETAPGEIKPTDESGLRTATHLVADAAEEMLESLSRLIMDPFGSHVIRALLVTMSPDPENGHPSNEENSRSKKSAAFKARHGGMRPVFGPEHVAFSTGAKAMPQIIKELATRMVETLKTQLSDNEIRALASDKVASPALQIMVRVESENGEADRAGSLMDRILMGLVTRLEESPSSVPVREDYIETLLRDPTSSHLVEAIVSYSPPRVFRAVWSTYFRGRLTKLATHPVSNFVVAKAVAQLDGDELGSVMREMEGAFGRTIKLGRTGVQRALVERATATQKCEGEVIAALIKAFGFGDDAAPTALVPCILRLQTLEDYTAAANNDPQVAAAEDTPEDPAHKRPDRGKQKAVTPTFSTQGVILLQSMLRVHEPHNQAILDSLLSLPIDNLLDIACDPAGSRVLDVILDPHLPQSSSIQNTIPHKARRRLIMLFLESQSFTRLVDDRLGSRIADRCWAIADPYLRERIAKSLIPHANFLVGSFYGKFFARNLHLTLLQRKPEEWKKMQIQSKTVQAPSKSAKHMSTSGSAAAAPVGGEKLAASTGVERRKEKKRKRDDVIDDIFDMGGKKKKTSVPAQDSTSGAVQVPAPASGKAAQGYIQSDQGLADVLGAIKEVPKGTALREGRKHKNKS